MNGGGSRTHGHSVLEDLWKALLWNQGAQDTRPLMVVTLFLSHCRSNDVVSLFRQRIDVIFDLLSDLPSLHGILGLWVIAGRARREHYLALRLGLRGQFVRLALTIRERRSLCFVPGRFSWLHGLR